MRRIVANPYTQPETAYAATEHLYLCMTILLNALYWFGFIEVLDMRRVLIVELIGALVIFLPEPKTNPRNDSSS